ncbi:MAG: hypothetical protein J6V40_01020 [Clostridia bacterium]|nr:hypothetical protein [Clostridia bacterium]
MNIVNVTLGKKLRPFTDIFIDGKLMTPKKLKGSKKTGFWHKTDKNYADIEIKTYSRFQSKMWFIVEMLFFIISVFGIFDQRFDKFCYTTHCKVRVQVNAETNVALRVITPRNNGVVARVETDVAYEAIENEYIIDRDALKKQKLLNKGKIAIVLLVIACAVVSFII